MFQSGDEPLRQAEICHLPLGHADVIRDAIVVDGALAAVVDSVAGSRIAVARLPYASGVDDEPDVTENECLVGGELTRYAVGAAAGLLEH